jgi:hypothetical protein
MRFFTSLAMLALFVVLFAGTVRAQGNDYWEMSKSKLDIPAQQLIQGQLPDKYMKAVLNVTALYQDLNLSPGQQRELLLPTPDGGMRAFMVTPTQVVAPQVAHLYTIRTFKGYAVGEEHTRIRCDISLAGFHAFVFDGDDSYAIEPVSKVDPSQHMVFFKKDLSMPGVRCQYDEDIHNVNRLEYHDEVLKTPTTLRTYRFAIIADESFRTQFGGTPYSATTVLNEMASGVNLVNGVYEVDMGVELNLVSNENCANAVLMDHEDIDEIHSFLVAELTVDGFDVGHSLIWQNLGGRAYLGVICNDNFKGGGYSAANFTVTTLYIDYVSHELGHQFAAVHTFASQECGSSVNNFRFEPGEGSTIMAYAGVCGSAPSYQNFSNPFFHAASLGQMHSYLNAFGSCATTSTPSTGNDAAPVVNANADITIPKETPFVLVGTATDDNSDPMTYIWQQYDGGGTATTGSPDCNSTTHPMFRFRPPVSDNFRIFPQYSDVLAGNNNSIAWEKLPCVDRTMNFRLTVRDNNTNFGRTGADDMVVTVANTGPFAVTAPNGGESWQGNTSKTVTWTVNGTDAHCTNVDILFSTDNGVTYALLGTYPNNGSASITVPSTVTSSARVLVQCSVAGNFKTASTFFDVSNAVFSVTAPAPCPGLRISQVYGGAGGSGALYNRDFVELYNAGPTPINLTGYSIQYAGATGTSWSNKQNLSGTIGSGKYFLIALASGTGVSALPTPDLDITPTINLAGSNGKLALVSSTTQLPSVACPTDATIVDFVGFGTADCAETTAAPAPSSTTSIIRANGGCTDTNNNSTDFATSTPTPRNSASAANTCGLALTITNVACPSNTGTISATGCGVGTVLEYATDLAGPWSTTAPTYTSSALTVYARCTNTTTNCSGPVASAATEPTSLSSAPGEIQITNSTCSTGCAPAGGSFAAPATGCPAGSTIQYSVDGGAWSTTLPTYDQDGPAQTVKTRCQCDNDANSVGPESSGVTTVPGTCTNPGAPTLSITNNTCPATTGTISATGCGAGTVVEYATGPTGPWSTTAPDYTTTAFTVYARCRNTTTDCVSTSVSEATNPTVCNTCPTLSAAPGEVQISNSACVAGCTVSNGTISAPASGCPSGSTIQYSVDGGAWTTTLPTYNQSTAQTIKTRCQCDIDSNELSPESTGVTTVLGSCTTPGAPTLTITDNTCPSSVGTISATGCGVGTVVEYATGPTGPWSTTAPTYTTTAFTVYARCKNTTTECVSSTVQATTNPTVCPCGTTRWPMNTASDTLNSVPNVSFGDISGGNTNGTATLISTSSASSGYTGASGGGNAGVPAFIGALNTATSTYFQVVITPAAGTDFTLTGISFGSRSTGTGPQAYSVRSSADGYATEIVGGTLPANSTWVLRSHADLTQNFTIGQSVTLRIYGYNGSGTPSSGSINWRIDDLIISGCSDNFCPDLSSAPGDVQVTNSSCVSPCTSSGGSIQAPVTGCPTGSTLQYSVDGGTWSATLPTYDQDGPAQNIKTRCSCDEDANAVSPESTGVTTVPGVCPTPTLSGNATVCLGETLQLTFTGTPATMDPFASSDVCKATVSGSGLVSGLDIGTVTITFTNSDGCTATHPVQVTNCGSSCDIAFTGATQTVPSCPGANDGSIEIGATSSAAITNYAIAGSSNANNSTGTFTGLAAGTYAVTVTDADGCTATGSVTLGDGVDTTDPTITCPDNISEGVDAIHCAWMSPLASITPVPADNCAVAGYTWSIQYPGVAPDVAVAAWYFEDATKRTASLAYTADAGSTANANTAALSISGANFGGWVTGAGGTGTFAASSNTWTAANAYWQVSINTEGFTNMSVSSKMAGSNTGPRNFEVDYSLDAVSWTAVAGSAITVGPTNNSFQSGVLVNVALPADCDNQPSVYIRWRRVGNVSVNGGTLASGGTNRFDDVVISGRPVPSGTGDASGVQFPLGLSTVTYTVTDEAGNTGTCSFTVDIVDDVAPAIRCTFNQTLPLGADCTAIMPDYAAVTTASDHCSSVTLMQIPMAGAAATVPGMQTVTMIATDAANNTSQCTFTVNIVDNTNPTATCNNTSLSLNGQASLTLDPNDLVTASDNCGVQSILLVPAVITSSQSGQNVPVSVLVTDVNGNSATCTSVVSLSGLPPGWSHSSGSVGPCTSNVEYNMGNGIWTATSTACRNASPYTSDVLTFAQYQLCGNGTIETRVNSISGGAGWAGIIMRESNAQGAKKVQMSINLNSNILRREVRYATGGQAFPSDFSSPSSRTWLRLQRVGNQFIGYASQDGLAWFYVMSVQVSMNSCIQIGLVVANQQAGQTVTTTFSNVFVTGGGAPVLVAPEYDAVDSGMTPEGFNVYPNPASSEINVDLTNYMGRSVRLELYNTQGKLMQIREIDQVGTDIEQLKVHDLAAGIYHVKLSSHGLQEVSRRVVIFRE